MRARKKDGGSVTTGVGEKLREGRHRAGCILKEEAVNTKYQRGEERWREKYINWLLLALSNMVVIGNSILSRFGGPCAWKPDCSRLRNQACSVLHLRMKAGVG